MSACVTCGEIGECVRVDLEAGEALPPAASKLEPLGAGKVRRCPGCGAWFLYTYDYEYGALGDGWETAELERIDRDAALTVLRDEKPTPVADDRASLVFRAVAAQSDPNPDVRLAAVKAAFGTPATKQMRVYRCPTCGSTDAGPDESRSRVDFTFMQCNGCGHCGLVDSWQRDFDWIADVEVPVDATTAPPHVAPLAPGKGLYDRPAVTEKPAPATRIDPPSTTIDPPSTTIEPLSKLIDPLSKTIDPLSKTSDSLSKTIDPPWRESDYDPTVVRRSSPAATPRRGPPLDWLLPAEEVDALWSLGVPLEAAWVPDDQLRTALAQRRVKRAVSTSSMGTTETYWFPATASDDVAAVRRDGVVLPRGNIAEGTPFEERADDRDVDGVLWEPFYREQYRALARHIMDDDRDVVLAELADMLAVLEERWGDRPKRKVDDAFVTWLRSESPVDTKQLVRWLEKQRKHRVRHLVDGIRARWITRNIESACDALLTSAKRFKDADTPRTTRLELLRCLAHHARARACTNE